MGKQYRGIGAGNTALGMKLAVSHPGKIGDLLFALPTVRDLSERHGCPVDVYTSSYCRPALEVIACQPYVGKATVLEEYVMDHYLWGAQPWQMPVPEGDYDKVYQLGFRAFPDRHCVAYVAHQVGLPEPEPRSFGLHVPTTGVVRRLGLPGQYVVITTTSATGGGSLTWAWSNDKVSDFVERCPHPIYAVGLEEEWEKYRCAGKFTGLPGLSFLEIGDVMKHATAVVTYSTGLGVLASGVLHDSDVALVCLFDGEISWDLFELPGAVTCSPDQDLTTLALRQTDGRELASNLAGVERARRAAMKSLTNTAEALTAVEIQLRASDAAHNATHRTLHERNLEVERLNRTLHQHNLEVERLNGTLHQHNREVERLNQALHERNLEVEKERAGTAAALESLDAASSALTPLRETLAEATRSLASQNAEIARLNEQISALRSRLASIEASRSWRWTKPLRSLVDRNRDQH